MAEPFPNPPQGETGLRAERTEDRVNNPEPSPDMFGRFLQAIQRAQTGPPGFSSAIAPFHRNLDRSMVVRGSAYPKIEPEGWVNVLGPPRAKPISPDQEATFSVVGRLKAPPKEPDLNIIRQLRAKQNLSDSGAEATPAGDRLRDPDRRGFTRGDRLIQRDNQSAAAIRQANDDAGYAPSGQGTSNLTIDPHNRYPVEAFDTAPADSTGRDIFTLKSDYWGVPKRPFLVGDKGNLIFEGDEVPPPGQIQWRDLQPDYDPDPWRAVPMPTRSNPFDSLLRILAAPSAAGAAQYLGGDSRHK